MGSGTHCTSADHFQEAAQQQLLSFSHSMSLVNAWSSVSWWVPSLSHFFLMSSVSPHNTLSPDLDVFCFCVDDLPMYATPNLMLTTSLAYYICYTQCGYFSAHYGKHVHHRGLWRPSLIIRFSACHSHTQSDFWWLLVCIWLHYHCHEPGCMCI